MQFRTVSIAAFLLVATWSATTTFGAIQVVNPNNPSGDNFTNPGAVNTGQDIVGTDWYYNNVRNNGVVGINTAYPRSGNGSVYFNGPNPIALSSKADIEFLPNATQNLATGNYSSGGVLGSLGQLSSLAYDWYRDSSSVNTPIQHPSLRLQVVSPDLSQFGYLVFERAYNGFGPTVPTDAWQSDNIFGSNYRMWSNGTLPDSGVDVGSRTLSQWRTDFPDYLVVGVSSGFGSGWDSFRGAVDNITFGFNGNDTTYNFEAQGAVPEPMTFAVWGFLGLCGFAYARHAAMKRQHG